MRRTLFLAALVLWAVAVESGSSVTRIDGGIITGGVAVGMASSILPNTVMVETDNGTPVLWIRNRSSSSALYPEINATNYAGASAGFPIFALYNMKGSIGAIEAAPTSFPLGYLDAASHDGTGYGTGAGIMFQTGSAWTATSHETQIIFKTVAAGEYGLPTERLWLRSNGMFSLMPIAIADLNSPWANNGTIAYCSDCLNASNPCTGSSTGAIAKRLNGAWDCR
jgi:hypothetical protein